MCSGTTSSSRRHRQNTAFRNLPTNEQWWDCVNKRSVTHPIPRPYMLLDEHSHHQTPAESCFKAPMPKLTCDSHMSPGLGELYYLWRQKR